MVNDYAILDSDCTLKVGRNFAVRKLAKWSSRQPRAFPCIAWRESFA